MHNDIYPADSADVQDDFSHFQTLVKDMDPITSDRRHQSANPEAAHHKNASTRQQATPSIVISLDLG